MTEENIFNDDGLSVRNAGEWVQFKIDYLNRYIDLFETSMRNKWSVRYYIDLLAGPGKNRIQNSGKIIPGSPLIALNTKYPFSNYIFNEVDKNSFSALEQRTIPYKTNSDIKLYNSDCNIVIDEVVKQLEINQKNSLNFSFIDPEGLQVRWETVEKLASVRRMDILLYYPVEALNRNMRKCINCNEDTKIDWFFGGNKWRDIYQSLESQNNLSNIHRELMDLIKSNLKKFGYIDFSSDHFQEIEPLIRNKERNAPLYRLIFASKHNLGNTFWKKIVKKDATGQLQLFS